ncbi:CvpA family protein [Petroclostridium sp. X23]|uniref:CvpA family protein n=1 Tax=Petroclostridium sp. X23 TaxID=3045146 RepID=UPI0024ACE6D4|nr:CvpA family protein [Petroclostridium sp. X23]WHH61685.1 CvpA family protein [Petroclostridium sp. X23]
MVTILDIAVILIIIFSSIRGMMKGFFLSVFDILSFFIAAILTARLYPYFAAILSKTKVYQWIQDSIYQIVVRANPIAIETTTSSIKDDTVKNAIDIISLPASIKDALMEQQQREWIEVININNINQQLAGGISGLIINVLSMIILFCAIKAILAVIASVINQFMKLPILNEVNKLVGGAFGIVSGIVVVYLICAFFVLLLPIEGFSPLAALIDRSVIVKGFYNNNILLEWIL